LRKVDRGSKVPKSLSKTYRGTTELDRNRAHFDAGRPQDFVFNAYKADDVHDALEKLFHGKCAYCEGFYASGAPMDVEHFRPKAGAENAVGVIEHQGYWWLASNWDNLFPSCIDCNRRRFQRLVQHVPHNPAGIMAFAPAGPAAGIVIGKAGKGNLFPVTGARATWEGDKEEDEIRGLVDPCRDRPDDHLSFRVGTLAAISLVYAIDDHAVHPKGQDSIDIYGLNRVALVQSRTHLMRLVELMVTIVVEVASLADQISAAHIVAALPAGVAQEMERRLRYLQTLVLKQLTDMASPQREYSTMVKAVCADIIDWL